MSEHDSDTFVDDDEEFEEYYTDDVNEENVNKGGRVILPPAFYLFKIADMIRKDDFYMVDLEVVTSSKGDDMEGEVHREFVSLRTDEYSGKFRLAFTLGCELTTKELIRKHRLAETPNPIKFLHAKGRYIAAELAIKQIKQKDSDGNEMVGDNGKPIWVDNPKGETRIPFDSWFHPRDKSLAKRGLKIDFDKLDRDDAFGGSAPETKAATKTADADF